LRGQILLGSTYRIASPLGTCFITVNGDPPIEIFINIGKAGSDVHAMAEALGRITSIGLQAGVDPMEVIHQFEGIGGRPVDDGEIRSVPDAVAEALKLYLEEK